MKKTVLAVALLFAGTAFAKTATTTTTTTTKTTATKTEEFKTIAVADLASSLQSKKADLYIYDANNEATRSKEGLIPGAKTLVSVNEYDAAATLPANKNAQLVFYCANTQCTASHDAAKVALQAGYTNVSILPDGIQGWKKAGQKTETYKKKS